MITTWARRCQRLISVLWFACLVGGLQACHSMSQLSNEAGVANTIETTAHFKHRVLFKSGVGNILHIYIEGDGLAWQSPARASKDPTPMNPTMFKLMLLDSAPSVYVGRPCYFKGGFDDLIEDPECEAYWWTFGRYSEKVVNSMAEIITQVSEGVNHIVLIGHSGGGTLATLIAEKNDKVVAVVTAGGNLNVGAWVNHHQYTPLYGSLDPSQGVVLPSRVLQLHYLGDADNEIKGPWSSEYLSRQPNAKLIMLPGVSHQEGWEKHWPAILSQLSHQLSARLADKSL